MKSKNCACALAVVVVSLLTAGSTVASTIPVQITNPDYVDPLTYSVNDWQGTGTWGEDGYYGNAPGSTGSAAATTAEIYQTLTTKVAANTDYALSAFLVRDPHGPTLTLSLYAAGSPDDLLGAVTPSMPTMGIWTPVTVNVAAASVPSGDVDKYLLIKVSTTDAWAYVDHWSLTTTTVPEPSTITLLIAGLLGLLAYAWRKQR